MVESAGREPGQDAQLCSIFGVEKPGCLVAQQCSCVPAECVHHEVTCRVSEIRGQLMNAGANPLHRALDILGEHSWVLAFWGGFG